MNPPWVYMCSPSWTPLLPPSPSHPSRSSQWTSSEHPVSCIKPGLAIHFTYDNWHVSMPFSYIILPSPSPTESKRLFYTSVSLLLFCIQGYRCHLSKFHIYALVYCIREKAMATHSSTLAWKIPWVEESGRLQSMGSWRVGHDWVTSLSCVGEEMATHSSVLSWRIPGTGQPDGLLSMGPQRVGHNWRDLASVAAYCIGVFLSGLLHSV